MPQLDYSLLGPRVDFDARVRDGMELGRTMVKRQRAQNALEALVRDPSNREARSVLMVEAPEVALKFEEAAYQRAERQRKADFRGGYSNFLLDREGVTPAAPQATALPSPGGVPAGAPSLQANALASIAPVAAQTGAMPSPAGIAPEAPAAPQPKGRGFEQTAAWRRMVQADPEAAMTVRANLSKITKEELEIANETTDQSLEMLATVRDQASYDAAKQRARAMYERNGQDPSFLDTMPAEYSPETIHALRTQAMETKDLLAALRQERRLEWDVEDDQIDNERSAEDSASLRSYRDAQVGLGRERNRISVESSERSARTSRENRRDTPAATVLNERGEVVVAYPDGRTTTLRNSRPATGQGRSRRNPGGSAVGASGSIPATSAAPIAEGTIIRKPGTNERMKRINGRWVTI